MSNVIVTRQGDDLFTRDTVAYICQNGEGWDVFPMAAKGFCDYTKGTHFDRFEEAIASVVENVR